MCVGVTCFFPSPSLPSACGSSRGESATFREEEVQLSAVLAFISFPLRFTAVLNETQHRLIYLSMCKARLRVSVLRM